MTANQTADFFSHGSVPIKALFHGESHFHQASTEVPPQWRDDERPLYMQLDILKF